MSESNAQDRYDRMLEDSPQMTLDERIARLKEQRVHIEELTAELRAAREEREQQFKETVSAVESDDSTPEVLTNYE